MNEIRMIAYNMNLEVHVVLLRWMRWCPYILTPKLSNDEWNQVPH